jgi:hypothetical protein
MSVIPATQQGVQLAGKNNEKLTKLTGSLLMFRQNSFLFKFKKLRWCAHTRVYPKVSGLAAWSENCK